MNKLSLLFLCLGFSLLTARAELLTFGSTSDLLDNVQGFRADTGVSAGDAEAIGVRLNARASESWLWFASISQADPGNFDDIAYGAGVLVTLPDYIEGLATGMKGSFHYLSGSDRSPQGRPVDVDVAEIAVRYVFSGFFTEDSSLRWFAELGLHSFQTSVSYPAGFDPGDRYPGEFDGLELGAEAGLIFDLHPQVVLFGSVEHVIETRANLGLGYRF